MRAWGPDRIIQHQIEEEEGIKLAEKFNLTYEQAIEIIRVQKALAAYKTTYIAE